MSSALLRSRSLSRLLLSVSLLGAPAAGCSAGSDDDGNSGSGAGSGSGAASGSGGSTGSFTTGVGGGSGDCVSCSSDLHSVIDCDGNVLEVCPPELACSPTGTCVPACQGSAENKSTIGCDFITPTPAVLSESRGSCFAVMIANTWTTPVSISATYGNQTIDGAQYTYIPAGLGPNLTYQPLPGGMLPPGQLGILFLSKYESGDIFQLDCPVPQALEMSTQVDASGMGQAFHIQTTAPVIAYDVYPWGGSPSFVSSATLLLPTPTWGTNFVTADAWEALSSFGNPWTQVVAAQDGTYPFTGSGAAMAS